MQDILNHLKQLINLLSDKDFLFELRTYRCAYQRLKVRLRNNLLTAQLKQLVTLNRQLQVDFDVKNFHSYSEQLKNLTDTTTKKKQDYVLHSVSKFLSKFIQFIDKLIDRTIHVYGYTQSHFKIGHLSHHLIILRTCLSRIRICFKALLIYACDLLIEISKICDHIDNEEQNSKKVCITTDQAIKTLVKHQCKPRLSHSAKSSESPEVEITCEISKTIVNEEVGQLIDRATMKPKKTINLPTMI